MVKVIANLLGLPEVYIDEEKIKFPFKKAEALFYYLLLRKESSRDILVNLLWGDLEENLAKKNLRNAVYSIKKLFNEEIIISPTRAIVALNPDIELILDIDNFLDENNKEYYQLYRGDFLEGFYVKDADKFEEWMISTKEEFKDIYIQKLQMSIKEHVKDKNSKEVKKYCKKLISIDEFNEKPYRLLMKIYKEESKYDKAVHIYNKLEKNLKEELNISPDKKTLEIYNEILNLKTESNICAECGGDGFFFGRTEELKNLNYNFNKFLINVNSKSFAVIGEAGIGKTRLICKFLSSIYKNNIYVLSSTCYQAEEEYLLKPWNIIFNQLSSIVKEENIKINSTLLSIITSVFPTFNMNNNLDINLAEKMDMIKYQAVEDAIIGVLNQISQNKKIILFMDDIQWIDNMSLSIIKSLLFKNRNKSVMVIAASRDGYNEKINEFLTSVEINNLIIKTNLDRLSKEDTFNFINNFLKDNSLCLDEKEKIYRETEGNIFFLTEILNMFNDRGSFDNISPKMENILQTRLFNLSRDERRILDIISVCFDKVKFDDLKSLWQESDIKLMDVIGDLEHKCLIREILNGTNIEITISHNKMREFVYSKLCLSEKIVLHSRIAKLFEGRLKNNFSDSLLYSKLIYHFENSGNKLKSIKYTIKNLNTYLQSYHEVFPVLYNYKNNASNLYLLNEEQVQREFAKIKEALEDVKNNGEDNEEYYLVEMEFLYMLARNYIRKGNYDEGLKLIQYVLNKAAYFNNERYQLKCYKQLMYYAMNIYDSSEMGKYVEEALAIVKRCDYKEEMAILYRLKGFQKLMEKRYEEAESILKKSIEMFEELNNRSQYVLNIAAAYDSIGECNRRNNNLTEGIKFNKKAISLCLDNGLLQGLPIFYVHAAQTAYELQDHDLCEGYIKKALELYTKMDIIWGRSIANGMYALILVEKNELQLALEVLKEGEYYSNILKNPYEIEILKDIEEKIKSISAQDPM